MKQLLILSFCCAVSCALHAQDDDINNPDNKVYSTFDFVAGSKTLFYDDFTNGLSKWKIHEHDLADDVTPAGIMNIPRQEYRWFKTPRRGVFYPLNVKTLPESFTIEFDMWADAEKMSEMESGLIVSFVDQKVVKDEYSTALDEHPQIQLDIHPSLEQLFCIATKENTDGERILARKDIKYGWKQGKLHRISISRNGTHVKVYIGEKKFIDLPNGLPVKTTYTLLLATNLWGDGVYITNFKLAQGETYPTKIDAQHKFVTTAIYFNTNSAVIKPESWPALNNAANAIKAANGVVVITGHTDSDGGDAENLALSAKRAEAVKQFLIKNFGIRADVLVVEGKGESAPIDTNSTPEGKANNRRVEFILKQ